MLIFVAIGNSICNFDGFGFWETYYIQCFSDNLSTCNIQHSKLTYFFFSCEWCLNSYIFFYKCCLYSFYKVNHGHSVTNPTNSAVSEHHFHTWKGTCIAETSQQTFRAEAFKKVSTNQTYLTDSHRYDRLLKKKKVTSVAGT